MSYILYNLHSKKPLVHPKIGLWISETKEQAEQLLKDCHDYVTSIGHKELIPGLVIRKIKEITEDN